MTTNNKYVLTIDGNEYRFQEEQELNNSKFNLEKLSYDMSDVVIGKALTRLWLVAIVLGLSACTDNSDKPAEVGVQTISNEMAAIRDYVPLYAVMAHRGSTYWAPEETESAWRWAREMGADYLESDLQCSKDGVIIANHDDNLKRTTNVEELFGAAIPATRMQFYESLGFSHEDALEQYQRDEASFRPYYMQSYYYAELLMLDAGKWFGESFAASRNGYFADGKLHYCTGQYVSALRDQIAYANGRMLQRKDDGERQLPYSIKPEYQGKTLHEIWQTIAAKGTYKDVYMDFLDYDFTKAYVDDPQDSGHRPGIYIEFKEPEVNPENMEPHERQGDPSDLLERSPEPCLCHLQGTRADVLPAVDQRSTTARRL